MDVDKRDEMIEKEHALQFVNSYTSALQSFLLINNTTEWNFGEQLLLHECGLTADDRTIDEKVLNETRVRGIFRRHDAKRAIFLHRLLRIQDGGSETEKRLNLMKKLGNIAQTNYAKWVKIDELRKEKEQIARQQAILEERKAAQAAEEEKIGQLRSPPPSVSATKKARVINPTFQERRNAASPHKNVSGPVPMETRVDLYDGASTTQSVELEAPATSSQDTVDNHSPTQRDEEDRGSRFPTAVLSSTRPTSNVQSLESIFEQDDILLQKKMIGAKRRLEQTDSDSDSGCSNSSTFKKNRLNKKSKKSKTRPRKRAKIDPNAATSFFRDGRQSLSRRSTRRG